MTFVQYKRAVGVIPNRTDVELALRELKKNGFPLDKISVIARQGSEEIKDIDGTPLYHHVNNKAKKGLATGAIAGGTLGGFFGLLLGLGTMTIVPGIGHVLFVGTVAHTIVTTIAGGTLGTAAGGLVGGLIGLGIPEEQAKTYHQQVVNGYYLLIIEGTEPEIEYAEQILDKYNIQEWEKYDVDIDTIMSDPQYYLRAIAVFSCLKDAKNAIIKLIETDFNLSAITMFTIDEERHDWFPNLIVHDSLDHIFEHLPDTQRIMFQDYFDQDAYIFVINGIESDLQCVKSIFQLHNLKIFYHYNPFQRDLNKNASTDLPLVR
ncbi:hypothetical protein VB735_30505 [Halotia wernerae UHCC 0503]|nr:hypothetical protein [Halotia wernerae UHCC 0503]